MTRAAVTLAAATLLTGCAFATPNVCPAIGYIYDVELQTHGEFAALEVCGDDACAAFGVESAPNGAQSAGSAFYLTEVRSGEWVVGSINGTFDTLLVRAYDDAGTVLAEESYDLDWTRTGGSERCGGPAEAPPVEFSV